MARDVLSRFSKRGTDNRPFRTSCALSVPPFEKREDVETSRLHVSCHLQIQQPVAKSNSKSQNRIATYGGDQKGWRARMSLLAVAVTSRFGVSHMSNDNLAMLARVRTLALSAMIQAGGKPCWVAAHAPDGSPAAAPCIPAARRRTTLPAPPPGKRPSLAPQYRPRLAPPAGQPGPTLAADDGSPLSLRELEALAWAPPAALAVIRSALARVSAATAANTPQLLPRATGCDGTRV